MRSRPDRLDQPAHLFSYQARSFRRKKLFLGEEGWHNGSCVVYSNVFAALFTGGDRLRGSAEDTREGVWSGQPRPLRRGSCYRRWGGWVQARFGRGGWYLRACMETLQLIDF
jgi:hypothetical protein